MELAETPNRSSSFLDKGTELDEVQCKDKTHKPTIVQECPESLALEIKTYDGVFSNLCAKPDPLKLPTQDNPPAYSHGIHEFEYEQTGAESIDELDYDGMEIGGYGILVLYTCVSFIFQWTGFLLAFLFSYCHAARYGSIIGLGCTMIVQSPLVGTLFEQYGNETSQAASFIFACFGYLLLLWSYLRFRRIRESAFTSGRVMAR